MILFIVLMILSLPALVNAQVDVNRVIEDKLYQLELHPYFRFFDPII
mgnify:CR=1 FL=1